MSCRTVVYANKYSIGGSSYNDLQLGATHTIMGSNKPFAPSTRVVIKAALGKNTYFQIVRIEEQLSTCTLWEDRGDGGRKWKYNYRFSSLTDICALDNKLNAFLDTAGKELQLNHKILFNAGRIGYSERDRLNPLMDRLLSTLKPK